MLLAFLNLMNDRKRCCIQPFPYLLFTQLLRLLPLFSHPPFPPPSSFPRCPLSSCLCLGCNCEGSLPALSHTWSTENVCVWKKDSTHLSMDNYMNESVRTSKKRKKEKEVCKCVNLAWCVCSWAWVPFPLCVFQSVSMCVCVWVRVPCELSARSL